MLRVTFFLLQERKKKQETADTLMAIATAPSVGMERNTEK
jgi:hypothetical protein